MKLAHHTDELPTLYQQFIHKSRYARWREQDGRRETWGETVDRYLDFMFDVQCDGKIPNFIKKELREGIISTSVMPSMRAMMTAGKALSRDHVAGFNCAFLPVDHVRAFDETLYILMCGTGVGYSGERRFTEKLPEVAEEFYPSDTTIIVRDSKIGWATSLRELISLLYAGKIPQWDLSKLRPAGAPLKTFGGRSSGPEPLNDLFHFAVNLFKKAAGRKLRPIECHDLMCKIADIVVVGGVRRSALICLGDLEDQEMRYAKSGDWRSVYPYRALANNSAVYDDRPSLHTFMKEWMALYESKSGERGIFNRQNARLQAKRTNRRKYKDVLFGCNPCVTADTWILTSEGPRQVSSLIDSPFIAIVDGKEYACKTGFFFTGNKKVYEIVTKEGFVLRTTEDHLIKEVNTTAKKRHVSWKKAKDFVSGDKISLGNHRNFTWSGQGTFSEGYILGQLVGDGGFVKSSSGSMRGYNRFWGESRKHMMELSKKRSLECLKVRSDFSGSANHINATMEVGCVDMANLATKMGISLEKRLGPEIEESSSDFYTGFLRGFFDADGSVQGDHLKGISVRLGQADRARLQTVQRMLARLGIISTISSLRKKAGTYLLPDGKGGSNLYNCKDSWDLIISKDNVFEYERVVGFDEPAKKEKLRKLLSGYKRAPNRERFVATVESVSYVDCQDVFDATVDEVHEFDANGIQVHNCSEINLRPNQFCNLSEVVARPDDTLETLRKKVRLATILGTMQASLSNFRYLRKIWRTNTEEEALLGVSITGIMDNDFLSGRISTLDGMTLPEALEDLKNYAVEVNREFAELLGINPAAAITCIKPSGTVSQLVNSSSGIHDRWAEQYIRNVLCDNKDPLKMMLEAAGLPSEDSIYYKGTTVFPFPIRGPKGSGRVDRSAIDQLELMLTYQKHWCEHKPSCTVYIGKDEWIEVADWVWKNFDEISGVAFLPKEESEHNYTQLPYQDAVDSELCDLESRMPEAVDWSMLSKFEKEDNTKAAKTFACTGDKCEIVDLV